MAFDHEKAQESSWRLKLYTEYMDTLASLALVPYHRCVRQGILVSVYISVELWGSAPWGRGRSSEVMPVLSLPW